MYGIIIDGMPQTGRYQSEDDAISVAESVLLDDDTNEYAQVFKIVKTMRKVTTIIMEGE